VAITLDKYGCQQVSSKVPARNKKKGHDQKIKRALSTYSFLNHGQLPLKAKNIIRDVRVASIHPLSPYELNPKGSDT
jgi:hypothetical protein